MEGWSAFRSSGRGLKVWSCRTENRDRIQIVHVGGRRAVDEGGPQHWSWDIGTSWLGMIC